jgi:hypothetical protein
MVFGQSDQQRIKLALIVAADVGGELSCRRKGTLLRDIFSCCNRWSRADFFDPFQAQAAQTLVGRQFESTTKFTKSALVANPTGPKRPALGSTALARLAPALSWDIAPSRMFRT